MNKLHVEAEHTAQAAPEVVWALVSDATTYPQWGPWRKAEYRSPGEASPHGQGAVYWLQADGTRIRWVADWDRTLAGRLVYRPLRQLYPQVVADLAAAAEKTAR